MTQKQYFSFQWHTIRLIVALAPFRHLLADRAVGDQFSQAAVRAAQQQTVSAHPYSALAVHRNTKSSQDLEDYKSGKEQVEIASHGSFVRSGDQKRQNRGKTRQYCDFAETGYADSKCEGFDACFPGAHGDEGPGECKKAFEEEGSLGLYVQGSDDEKGTFAADVGVFDTAKECYVAVMGTKGTDATHSGEKQPCQRDYFSWFGGQGGDKKCKCKAEGTTRADSTPESLKTKVISYKILLDPQEEELAGQAAEFGHPCPVGQKPISTQEECSRWERNNRPRPRGWRYGMLSIADWQWNDYAPGCFVMKWEKHTNMDGFGMRVAFNKHTNSTRTDYAQTDYSGKPTDLKPVCEQADGHTDHQAEIKSCPPGHQHECPANWNSGYHCSVGSAHGGCRSIDQGPFPAQDCTDQCEFTVQLQHTQAVGHTHNQAEIESCPPEHQHQCPASWNSGYHCNADPSAGTAHNGCRSMDEGPFPAQDCTNQCRFTVQLQDTQGGHPDQHTQPRDNGQSQDNNIFFIIAGTSFYCDSFAKENHARCDDPSVTDVNTHKTAQELCPECGGSGGQIDKDQAQKPHMSSQDKNDKTGGDDDGGALDYPSMNALWKSWNPSNGTLSKVHSDTEPLQKTGKAAIESAEQYKKKLQALITNLKALGVATGDDSPVRKQIVAQQTNKSKEIRDVLMSQVNTSNASVQKYSDMDYLLDSPCQFRNANEDCFMCSGLGPDKNLKRGNCTESKLSLKCQGTGKDLQCLPSNEPHAWEDIYKNTTKVNGGHSPAKSHDDSHAKSHDQTQAKAAWDKSNCPHGNEDDCWAVSARDGKCKGDRPSHTAYDAVVAAGTSLEEQYKKYQQLTDAECVQDPPSNKHDEEQCIHKADNEPCEIGGKYDIGEFAERCKFSTNTHKCKEKKCVGVQGREKLKDLVCRHAYVSGEEIVVADTWLPEDLPDDLHPPDQKDSLPDEAKWGPLFDDSETGGDDEWPLDDLSMICFRSLGMDDYIQCYEAWHETKECRTQGKESTVAVTFTTGDGHCENRGDQPVPSCIKTTMKVKCAGEEKKTVSGQMDLL